MKNFEKYEKEIKEAVGELDHFAEGILIEKYHNITQKESCSFSEIANWLYEEYKEPLLTDEEREYLRLIISPFRKYVKHFYCTIQRLSICIEIEDCKEFIEIPCAKPNELFKGLEHYKEYSLEKLGL